MLLETLNTMCQDLREQITQSHQRVEGLRAQIKEAVVALSIAEEQRRRAIEADEKLTTQMTDLQHVYDGHVNHPSVFLERITLLQQTQGGTMQQRREAEAIAQRRLQALQEVEGALSTAEGHHRKLQDDLADVLAEIDKVRMHSV